MMKLVTRTTLAATLAAAGLGLATGVQAGDQPMGEGKGCQMLAETPDTGTPVQRCTAPVAGPYEKAAHIDRPVPAQADQPARTAGEAPAADEQTVKVPAGQRGR